MKYPLSICYSYRSNSLIFVFCVNLSTLSVGPRCVLWHSYYRLIFGRVQHSINIRIAWCNNKSLQYDHCMRAHAPKMISKSWIWKKATHSFELLEDLIKWMCRYFLIIFSVYIKLWMLKLELASYNYFSLIILKNEESHRLNLNRFNPIFTKKYQQNQILTMDWFHANRSKLTTHNYKHTWL